MGDPDGVLGSYLWPGPAPTVAGLRGSEPADGRALYFSCDG